MAIAGGSVVVDRLCKRPLRLLMRMCVAFRNILLTNRISLAAYWRLRILHNHVSERAMLSRLRRCGGNCKLWMPVAIESPQTVEFGNDVCLAAFVHLWGSGGVKIGNRVMIGTHTSISSVTHDYERHGSMYGTIVESPVVIGDDVWIASNATILPGITIGDGAVVGAGAVVTRDVAPRDIVAGVPARVLKKRPEKS